jgi:hypothetical protein
MPSPTERVGERAGSILRATTTTELVRAVLGVVLALPPAELVCDCWGEWGRGDDDAAGMLLVVREGVRAAARKRRACACSCSRMNPWKRFRRIHFPRLTVQR